MDSRKYFHLQSFSFLINFDNILLLLLYINKGVVKELRGKGKVSFQNLWITVTRSSSSYRFKTNK